MKNWFITGVVIGFLAALLLLPREECPPEGYSLISNETIDSINNLKPDTIIIEKQVIIDNPIVYNDKPIPEPVKPSQPISGSDKPDSTLNFYADSLINDTTYLVIHDWVRGTIEQRDIILKRSVIIRELRIPYPQFFETVKTIEKEWKPFLYGGIDVFGNQNSFFTGAELGVSLKNRTTVGIKFVTDFDQRFYGISVAKPIF